jgi:hypothetical protein
MGVDMRRFSLLSFLALVLTVLVTVLGPAGVAAASMPAATPANHEPCDPDADNDCKQGDAGGQDPCDAEDYDCTPGDASEDHGQRGDQDPCDPDDKDCTPDDAKHEDKDKDHGKGDGAKCDPDDKDCGTKDPGDEDNGGGEGAVNEIVTGLIGR